MSVEVSRKKSRELLAETRFSKMGQHILSDNTLECEHSHLVHEYALNQFTATSDVYLPCSQGESFTAEVSAHNKLTIKSKSIVHSEFDYCYLVGISSARNFRAYETEQGLLLSASAGFKLLISEGSDYLYYDVSECAPFGKALLTNVLMNLALAIRTLLMGGLPIHCASVMLGDKLVGIAADSGIGKSTLLWQLLKSGCRLAADDVLTVLNTGKVPIASPSRTIPSKISKRTADHFGISTDGLLECVAGTGEYWIRLPPKDRQMLDTRLAALFVLAPDTIDAVPQGSPRATRIKCTDTVATMLIRHTQGLWASAPMLNEDSFMRICRATATHTPMFILQYERSFKALPSIVDTMRRITDRL